MENLNLALQHKNSALQTIVDEVSLSLSYVCEANPGVASSDTGWRIKKIVLVGTVTTIEYPIDSNGNVNTGYNFIADNRASYTYGLVSTGPSTPTLSTVSISSSNATPTLAKVGDIVSLTIVSSENIVQPNVTIAGNVIPDTNVVRNGVQDSNWVATYTMVSADTAGAVTFTVDFKSLIGVEGTQVTAVTDASSVTFDNVVGTITTATMASNNTDTTLAKTGDVVTLTFISSEPLQSKPTVTIAGHAIIAGDVTQGIDTSHWTATYTMVSGDTSGLVAFTINGLDLAGNPITQQSTLTAGVGVTFDKTAVTGAITYSIVTPEAGQTQVITANFSEPIKDSPVVNIEISGSQTLVATAMTKVTTTQYTYNYTVVAGDGVATCAFSVGVDLAGNPITATPTSGATFSVLTVLPTMLSATRIANTTLRVTLSEDADTATTTKANDGGFVVFETGAPATTYAVSAIAPNGSNHNQVDLTVASVLASSAVGVTITYSNSGNGTVADVNGNLMATDIVGQAIPNW